MPTKCFADGWPGGNASLPRQDVGEARQWDLCELCPGEDREQVRVGDCKGIQQVLAPRELFLNPSQAARKARSNRNLRDLPEFIVKKPGTECLVQLA